jgi:hypothetical protein
MYGCYVSFLYPFNLIDGLYDALSNSKFNQCTVKISSSVIGVIGVIGVNGN